jgi:hypothetical protein
MQGMGRKDLLHIVGGNVISVATMEISMAVPQKTKNRVTKLSCYTTLGQISEAL